MAKDGAVHRTDYGRYELQTVNGGRNSVNAVNAGAEL
jgi:hypothetical protein